MHSIAKNTNIRIDIVIDIVEKNPDKPWNFECLSGHPNLTIDFINKYPNEGWNWERISYSLNLSIEIFEKYPELPWDWEQISANPSLTIEMIYKYPDEDWEWEQISENSFEKEYEIELKKLKFEKYHEELIAKTWHPSRFKNWCLDEDQKKDEEE